MKATTQTGFTLIELMVTLSVIAILALVVVPGLQSILATSDLNAAQENIVQILKKGHGMAMSRSTFATVVVSGSSATLTMADGSDAGLPVVASNRVSLGTAATYVFSPNGTATATPNTGTVLTVPSNTSIAARTITVTTTGQINVSR